MGGGGVCASHGESLQLVQRATADCELFSMCVRVLMRVYQRMTPFKRALAQAGVRAHILACLLLLLCVCRLCAGCSGQLRSCRQRWLRRAQISKEVSPFIPRVSCVSFNVRPDDAVQPFALRPACVFCARKGEDMTPEDVGAVLEQKRLVHAVTQLHEQGLTPEPTSEPKSFDTALSNTGFSKLSAMVQPIDAKPITTNNRNQHLSPSPQRCRSTRWPLSLARWLSPRARLKLQALCYYLVYQYHRSCVAMHNENDYEKRCTTIHLKGQCLNS
eukprot:COSAG02_NODE_6636_length_3445_cov_56.495218_1_plen_273_part_00